VNRKFSVSFTLFPVSYRWRNSQYLTVLHHSSFSVSASHSTNCDSIRKSKRLVHCKEIRSCYLKEMVKVKRSCYRPGVAQTVGRGIALLFHDRGTRRGWVVSSTPRPHFIPGKDSVPILQEAGWAPGPIWTGRKSRPHRDSIPDRPARSQSLYRLSYRVHCYLRIYPKFKTSQCKRSAHNILLTNA